MIRDRNIEWARQRLFIPVWAFQGWTLADGEPNTIVSAAIATPPQMTELSDFGLMLMQCAAGDTIAHVMAFPSYWDISQEIWVRIWWTHDTAGAANDAVTWLFKYDQVDVGEAIIAPATALDTPFASHVVSSTTEYTLERTPKGVIAANKFDESALDGLFSFSIESDVLTNIGADEPHLIGVEFSYMPRMTVGLHQTTRDERG